MTDIKPYRGSEWRKWDLHVHTPLSIEQEYGGDTEENWNKFIENLEALPREIKALGINDYIFIDGYKRVINEKAKGRLKNINLILPVIELRIDKFGNLHENDPLKRVNFHIIFSNELDPQIIQSQFLDSLSSSYKLDYSAEPNRNDWGGLLTKSNLISLGRRIIDSSNGQIKGSALKVGFNSLNIPYSDLLEKLENPHFYKKHLTAIGKTEWDALRWNSSPAEKKSIINKVNFIFSASPTVENALKSKATLSERNVNSKLLHCSDAHTYSGDIKNTKPKELGHCYTWIKADLTFEGLKQVIYEPDSRLRIQEDEPDFKEDKLIIDKVRFVSQNKKFTSQSIHLNKNLNVIIGGKSSGKSILLYHIAKTLVADVDFLKKENIENKYKFEANDPTFNFEITTKGGFSQFMLRGNEENSIIPEIKYIPQNYLVKLAEPDLNKKGNALNKIVRGLINEDSDSQASYDEFISRVRSNDRKRDAIVDNYFEIKERISLLETQLKLKSNKKILETNIATNTQKIEELNASSGMPPDEIEKYNQLQVKLEIQKSERTKASNDYRKIMDFNSEAVSILSNLENKKSLLSHSLETQSLKKIFDHNYTQLNNLITSISEFRSKFETVKNSNGASSFKITSEISTLFVNLSKNKNEVEAQMEPYIKNNEIKKQIEVISKSVSEDRNTLHSIDQLRKEIDENREALKNEKEKLFVLYEETYYEYINIADKLKSRTNNLEKDGLKITGLPKYNYTNLQKEIIGISDGRSASYNKYEILNEGKTALDDYNLPNLIGEVRAIFEAITETNTYSLSNSKTDKKAAIKKLMYDHFFDYWKIEYKNDKLGEMSTGKASFVILMLIVGLSKSKAPILIDQPEDNLDNRSITTDLVEYLRNKKSERQIILVTHNPNIVVNADAENVIVANQKGQNEIESSSSYIFDYTNGALENSTEINTKETDLLKSMGIREHIAEIVEGGKEAFKKREEKYGF